MSQADRNKLAMAKHLAELAAIAAEYGPEAVATAVEVMRNKDPFNRQRLAAATLILKLIADGQAEGNGNNGAVKIVVVSANDMQRLGEMHRAEVKGT